MAGVSERCGREFANRNQSHACGRRDLEHHFAGKPPAIRALFDAVVAAIRSVQTFSPRNHVQTFRLEHLADIDDEFRQWLAEAYAVGEQKHLAKG